MTIDRVNISNQGIDRSQSTQPNELVRSGGKDKDRQVQPGSDSVAFSSKAAEMNKLANTVEESRTDRINKVRAQLEAGTYRVSSKDLAKKLIDANQK